MFKELAFRAMETRWFTRALEGTGHGGCVMLFMHRFAERAEAIGRHDPHRLGDVLEHLRKAGVDFVSLEQAVAYHAGKAKLNGRLAVSFTVDDGYADFAELGWPVFRKFDCPVSLFVVPGVINGDGWFWWDRLRWLMNHIERREISFIAGEQQFRAHWHDDLSRHAVFEEACEWLKQRSADELNEALRALAARADLSVPSQPPSSDRVLSWPELRALEQQGLRIGAHSMTHPVLSRCSDSQAAWEIAESVRQVNMHMAQPLSVFAYPNGRVGDHGLREWHTLAETGVQYAVTTASGVLEPVAESTFGEFRHLRLPRVGYQLQAGQIIREFLG